MAFEFKNRSTTNVWKNSTTEDWTSQLGRGFLKSYFEELYDAPLRIFWDESYHIAYNRWKIVDQIYHIPFPLVNFFDLRYGGRPTMIVSEPYSDIPVPLKLFSEPYESAYTPLKFYTELYGTVLKPQNIIDNKWDIVGDLVKLFDESYAITSAEVKTLFDESYDVQDVEHILKNFDENYHILQGSTQYMSQGASILIDNTFVEFDELSMSMSESSYLIECSIVLSKEDDFRSCSLQSDIVCDIDGIVFNFFVETMSEEVEHGKRVYTLEVLSPTAKLDVPYSSTITKNYPNGISSQALAQEMVDVQGITLDYQLPDWDIPSHVISINRETPIEVLRRLTTAIGGIMQTKPDGTLLLISKYPVAVSQWDSQTPSSIFDIESDLLNLSYSSQIVDGFNAYAITDQGYSSTSISLEEETINSTTKIIRGFRVPFDDGEFDLETSGGIDIVIDKTINPVEAQIPRTSDDEEWETIEFVEFTGKTSNPIYEVIDYEWLSDDLGAFQISEDGTLDIIDQSSGIGASLLKLKYKTKYWKWTVTCPHIRQVQFYVPEVA